MRPSKAFVASVFSRAKPSEPPAEEKAKLLADGFVERRGIFWGRHEDGTPHAIWYEAGRQHPWCWENDYVKLEAAT